MKAPLLGTCCVALWLVLGCSAPAEDAKTSATIDVAKTSIATTLAARTAAPRIAASPADSAVFARLPEATRRAFENADVVVSATLADARIDSVLEVAPPIYVHRFDVVVAERLGGARTPDRVSAYWQTRDVPEALPNGKPMLVALKKIEGTLPTTETTWETMVAIEATPELERAIASQRSAADEALSISVAQVPSVKTLQWQNDYGDGEFDLTIKNEGSSPVTVPHLFKAAGVLWNAAIVVRDQQGTAHEPANAGLPDGAQPVTLAPGASLTTRVDVKPFGVVNPAGGARYYYSFSVGELRVSSFFYYTDSLHGPMMGHR